MAKQNKTTVTRYHFTKYEYLRRKGLINMNDITTGAKLTGMPENIYKEIIHNYDQYKAKFKI